MQKDPPCSAGLKWVWKAKGRPRNIHRANLNNYTLVVYLLFSILVCTTTNIGDKRVLFCFATNTSIPHQCYSCSENNPCTAKNIDKEKFHFAHCDRSNFVQCDTFGSCFELQCPTGAIWNSHISACILQRSSDTSSEIVELPPIEKRMQPSFNISSLSTQPSPQKNSPPSASPSHGPSFHSNQLPSELSPRPSSRESNFPSHTPISKPSPTPSFSSEPSFDPTVTNPNESHFTPTLSPSVLPSLRPQLNPSIHPSLMPTRRRTFQPSITPSATSSNNPSAKPTTTPSQMPSFAPLTVPAYTPSSTPSLSPSSIPFTIPSFSPSTIPSGTPTSNPSFAPSSVPSRSPSTSPSYMPTTQVYKKCGMDNNERIAKMTDILNNASNLDLLQSTKTPQHKAFQWITEYDLYISCPQDDNVMQRYVMAVFYFSTSGGEWDECNAPINVNDAVELYEKNDQCSIRAREDSYDDAWLTPSNECFWGGLACDNGLITRIQFGDDGLKGTLPTELQHLDALQYLLLEDGRTSGTIPSEYGKLSNLRVLDLNYNLLSGAVPIQIYGLPNLLQLDLNDNFFEGTISPLIANLKKLEFLQLHRNVLTGLIPEAMGLMKELHVLDLHENMLTGSMPESVCQNRDTQSGFISQLTADCDDSFGFAMVECAVPDCCTSC